jgi:hypothetical protein
MTISVVIASAARQSAAEIATPCGLAMTEKMRACDDRKDAGSR